MTVVRESHFSDFSLYFLATLPEGTEVPDPTGDGAKPFVRQLYSQCVPILELTHNHGTENDPEFVHDNGNVEPKRGFGHIGYGMIECDGGELASQRRGPQGLLWSQSSGVQMAWGLVRAPLAPQCSQLSPPLRQTVHLIIPNKGSSLTLEIAQSQ